MKHFCLIFSFVTFCNILRSNFFVAGRWSVNSKPLNKNSIKKKITPGNNNSCTVLHAPEN